MPAGESEAKAKTKARFEEVFRSYAGITADKRKPKKKSTSQDSIVLETLRNKLDISKETEDDETVLNNTYNPAEGSPRFTKNKQRDRASVSEKINNDIISEAEGKEQRKKKNVPVEGQFNEEKQLFKTESHSLETDTRRVEKIKSKSRSEHDVTQQKSEKKRPKHAMKEQMSRVESQVYEDEEEQQLIQAYQQQVVGEEATEIKSKIKKKLRRQMAESTPNVTGQEVILNNELKIKKKKTPSAREAEARAMSLSDLRDSQLEATNKKKKKKIQGVFTQDSDTENIKDVEKQRTDDEVEQQKTKRKKEKKKKASGEETESSKEPEGPALETEMQEDGKKQVFDDSLVLGVYIHRTDRLKMDLMVSHPMVKVHVIDENTGLDVKKENSHRPVSSFYEQERVEHILPIMTQPYYFKKFKSTIPEWEELIIFNERFGYFLQETEEQPKVILFFEVLDFLSVDEARANFDVQNQERGFCKIAWAFLKLVGANGVRNIDGKLRLQLYYPPHRTRTRLSTAEIFDWWKNSPRERYPSTLYVTVKGLKLPDHVDPSVRSMMALQQEQGSSSYRELQSEMARKGSESALDGKKVELLKWTRLPGQVCRIPNKHLLSLRTGQRGCFCIRFSHDGKTLAAACADKDGNPIILYEVPSGRYLREFNGHLNIVYDLCWSRDDKNFLSASSDGTVRLWKSMTQSNLSDKVLPHPSFVYVARYHPFAEYLVVTGCYDCVIRVWNVRVKDVHGQLLQEIAGHKSFINTLCFDAEGLRMFSADSSGLIIVWNTFINESSQHHPSQQWCSDKEIRENDLKGVPVNHLEVHPNGRRLLIHAKDSTLRVMDLRILATKKFTGAINYREKIHSTFTPCGTFLFSGSEDGIAYVWNAETGDQVAMYSELCYTTPLRDVAFHPHEHMVAFCAFGQNQPILVYIYDHKVAQLEAETVKDLSGTLTHAIPKGPRILSSGSDMAGLQDSSSADRFASAARMSMRMQKVKQKLDSVLDLTSQGTSKMDHLYNNPGMAPSIIWDLPGESSVISPVSSSYLHPVTGSNLSLPAPSLLSPHSKLRLPSTLGAQLISQQSWTTQSGGFSPVGQRPSHVPSLRRQASGLDPTSSFLKVETDGFAPHETVVALYDYTAHRSDELTLHRSDIIQVLYKDNDNWWFGRLTSGQQGYFPANYVAGERDYEEEQLLPTGRALLTSPVNEQNEPEESSTPTKMSAVISKSGELKFISEHDDTDTESPVTKAARKKKKKPGASKAEMNIQQPTLSCSAAAAADEPGTSVAAVKKKKKKRSIAVKSSDGEANTAFEPDELSSYIG